MISRLRRKFPEGTYDSHSVHFFKPSPTDRSWLDLDPIPYHCMGSFSVGPSAAHAEHKALRAFLVGANLRDPRQRGRAQLESHQDEHHSV